MITTDYSARNTTVVDLPIDDVHPSDLNPRKHFDDTALAELAESIRRDGVMQPIVVRPRRFGPVWDDALDFDPSLSRPAYDIVMGERRWRASKLAGRETIPAVIRDDIDDANHLRLALIENLQRQDLDPIEEARGYQRLHDEVGLKQQAIAEAVNRSQPAVANAIRLLDLPEEIQTQISAGVLSVSHGLALLKWRAFPGVLSWLAQQVRDEGWSTKTVEGWKPSGVLPMDLTRRLGDYATTFDQSVCKTCPFNARKAGEYGQEYCLNPAHWVELEDAAVRDKQAASVARMAEVKGAAGEGVPHIRDLRSASEISGFHQSAPDGCTADCPCRVRAINYQGDVVDCCTDWQRINALREAERKARAEARAARLVLRAAELSAAIDRLDDLTVRDLAPIVATAVSRYDEASVRQAGRHLGDVLPTKNLAKHLTMQGTTTLTALLAACDRVSLLRFGLEAVLLGDLTSAANEWGTGDEGKAAWYLDSEPALSPSGNPPVTVSSSTMVACAICAEPTFVAEGIPVEINGQGLLACAACGEFVEENQDGVV